jgi:hypothetical protein
MNTNGSFYSAFGVNPPKEIRTFNTKRTKYLSVPQECITEGKINANIYVHCSIPELAARELS